MARTWWSIRVDLVDGAHAHEVWPRPGRLLLARPGMTFRSLADAINLAFGRWDLAHPHAFTLADGTRISLRGPWDDLDENELDDTQEKLSRLQPGEAFVFEFDFGDRWTHLCTVDEEKVDPLDVYGERPDQPVPYFGWGALPDQYGRRWDEDDGSSQVPPPPEPPLSDLPPIHHGWGSGAVPTMHAIDDGGGAVVRGPWPDAAPYEGTAPPAPWPFELVKELRGAVYRRDLEDVVELLLEHDPLAVAHLAAPALLDAVQAGYVRAGLVVVPLEAELQQRGWLGDDELVAELERVAGGEPGELRPTPVDLDELAMHLDGPTDLDEGSMLEVATGQLWPSDPMGMTGIEPPEDFEDPDRFKVVLALGSRPGYGDMRDFIDTVTDDELAGRLSVSIQGKGAFRRFRDTLHEDERWWSEWGRYSSERQLARARWWLAEAGLRPATAGDQAQ